MFKRIFKNKLKLNDFNIYDETNSADKNKIETLIAEFIQNNKLYNLTNFKVNIIITNNFLNTVYNYSSYEQQMYISKFGLPIANGQYCSPIEHNNIHTIVINKDIMSDILYFGTVIHELKHVFDFESYINYYGNPNFMDELTKKQNYYYDFFLWTEFHAKLKGQERLLIEYEKYEYSVAYRKITKLFKEQIINSRSKIDKLYQLMHFFARITASKNEDLKLDKDIYPLDFIEQQFTSNGILLHSIMERSKHFTDFQNNKTMINMLCNW